jgi:hypothetical protein
MPRRGSLQARRGTVLLGAGAVLAGLDERTFQREHVVGALKARRWVAWTVPRMHMTSAGLPDIIAYHPLVPGVVLFWELKTEAGKERPAQTRALRHLRTVPGADVRVIRPSDWARIRDCLDRPCVRVALAAEDAGREEMR